MQAEAVNEARYVLLYLNCFIGRKQRNLHIHLLNCWNWHICLYGIKQIDLKTKSQGQNRKIIRLEQFVAQQKTSSSKTRQTTEKCCTNLSTIK